jgi:CRP-like cAMP-binding protein
MATTDKRDLLARHYMFCDVDPAVVDRVAELGVTIRLKSGQELFRKGDEGNALFGVLSGKVCISSRAPNGREVILNVMEPGDVFGEIALLDGLPRTADATAMDDCALIQIQRRDFIPLLEREPRLSVHLLELLCERLRWTSDMIEDSAFLSLPARLAKRLLNLAIVYGESDGPGVRIGLKLSQTGLGQMMGTSRESINRHLQDWAKNGWIQIGRSRVTLLDRQALQELVDHDLDS